MGLQGLCRGGGDLAPWGHLAVSETFLVVTIQGRGAPGSLWFEANLLGCVFHTAHRFNFSEGPFLFSLITAPCPSLAQTFIDWVDFFPPPPTFVKVAILLFSPQSTVLGTVLTS